MKYSYSFENKVFSVVVTSDGGVIEIRRGEVTFPRGATTKPNRWTSLDEWRATWPVGANQPAPKTNTASSSTDPILNLFYKHKIRTGLTFGPPNRAESDAHVTIRYYSGQLKACQADPVKYGDYIAGAQQQIEVAKKTLTRCKRYKAGTYDFPARIVGTLRVYVMKDGALYPVVHHGVRGLVRVCEWDATSRKHTFISPSEFGIDDNSQFLLRDPCSSIMTTITV
jgi:hypothetical protein